MKGSLRKKKDACKTQHLKIVSNMKQRKNCSLPYN